MEVTPEQIKETVAEVLAAEKERLLVERYRANSKPAQNARCLRDSNIVCGGFCSTSMLFSDDYLMHAVAVFRYDTRASLFEGDLWILIDSHTNRCKTADFPFGALYYMREAFCMLRLSPEAVSC